ncbi:MAG: hypothetical protein R3A78_16005 [Polyangiales bacterium]
MPAKRVPTVQEWPWSPRDNHVVRRPELRARPFDAIVAGPERIGVCRGRGALFVGDVIRLPEMNKQDVESFAVQCRHGLFQDLFVLELARRPRPVEAA